MCVFCVLCVFCFTFWGSSSFRVCVSVWMCFFLFFFVLRHAYDCFIHTYTYPPAIRKSRLPRPAPPPDSSPPPLTYRALVPHHRIPAKMSRRYHIIPWLEQRQRYSCHSGDGKPRGVTLQSEPSPRGWRPPARSPSPAPEGPLTARYARAARRRKRSGTRGTG